jgi:hypothetical protein
MPQPEQSSEADTAEPGGNVPVESMQESTATDDEQPKGGCKSFVGACVPAAIIAAGAVCFKKRKRK